MTRMQILGSRRQSGQALTEFLVAAIALIPLLLLIPVIAKYQDISHVTQLASRYVAFESTQRNDATGSFKSEAQLAAEVRRRYFSNPDAPIKSNDEAGDFKAHQNLYWRDPKGNPLIKNFSDIQIGFGEGNAATHANAFKVASDGKPFNLVPIANASTLGLQSRGIYRANISVALVNLPAGIKAYEPFDKIDLRITRQTSVAIDSWSARSAENAEDRSGRLAPINQMLNSGVGSLVGTVITLVDLGGVSPPQFGRLDLWRDVVPVDRLRAPLANH